MIILKRTERASNFYSLWLKQRTVVASRSVLIFDESDDKLVVGPKACGASQCACVCLEPQGAALQWRYVGICGAIGLIIAGKLTDN